MQSGPSPAEMRGRAAEINDPSAFGWQEIWEALKTEPPADDPSTITQEHDPGAPPQLDGLLAGLAPSPKVWRQLEVTGGTDGILARRPVTAHSQGFVYDLWLVERLADQLGHAADVPGPS